ncbi:putative smc domain-containing protein [Erysiphe neolycopersici]|uniref:Putative smc domain-containing protein n=1 Tax=Erysiphe neolycopersici TaxID=212602 RepID=A0A420HWK4_9PEZI|nr:putative smc domain-containing protein [Erysiphe neolycopersici]
MTSCETGSNHLLSNSTENSILVPDLENSTPREFVNRPHRISTDHETLSSVKFTSSRPSSICLKNFELSRSPRKLSSPDRRFPVKPYSPPKQPPTAQSPSIEDVLHNNEGISKVIEILEGKNSDNDNDEDRCSDDTLTSGKSTLVADDDSSNMDDTIISTYSTFSAVPDLTMFSRLRQNTIASNENTTILKSLMTPATSRRSLSKPLYEKGREEGYTTNLLDFTSDVDKFTDASSPARIARHLAMQGMKPLDASLVTSPSVKRHTLSNLIDFEIPPAPTPRSIPTITPRELESLKSGFLCEISSLKASLSGKEAEVLSLKSAVGDAEKRVGESLQQFREEQSHRQQLAADKENWETRGREMESLLRSLQEQILLSEQNRDELEGRLAESDARRHAAELMAQEAESRVAALRAGRSSPENETKSQGAISEGKLVELAVENVSKELHALYKDKHEAKVAALKKSYERRWDKRVQELEKQVEDLIKENKELKVDQNDKLVEAMSKSNDQNMEKINELEAKFQITQCENSELKNFLKKERAEKEKLVQTVEEMIPLIASFDELLGNMDKKSPPTQPNKFSAQSLDQGSNTDNPRGGQSKTSGIRAPMCHSNIGESRIGKGGFGVPAPRENRSRSTSSMARPLSGIACKSGIMTSIERMGSNKGRGKC